MVRSIDLLAYISRSIPFVLPRCKIALETRTRMCMDFQCCERMRSYLCRQVVLVTVMLPGRQPDNNGWHRPCSLKARDSWSDWSDPSGFAVVSPPPLTKQYWKLLNHHMTQSNEHAKASSPSVGLTDLSTIEENLERKQKWKHFCRMKQKHKHWKGVWALRLLKSSRRPGLVELKLVSSHWGHRFKRWSGMSSWDCNSPFHWVD